MSKKKKLNPYKNISLKQIEKELSKHDIPSIKHFTWEENGKRYSSWQIRTGTLLVNTGDAGMALLIKAIKEDAEKYLKS